jgi:hypothetical protein
MKFFFFASLLVVALSPLVFGESSPSSSVGLSNKSKLRRDRVVLPSSASSVSSSRVNVETGATFSLCLQDYYCDLVADTVDAGDLPTVQDCADACDTINYKYFDYAPVAGGGFTCWCDNDCPIVTSSAGWATYAFGSRDNCVFTPTAAPTAAPTFEPSTIPTYAPSAEPTFSPTATPSFAPSAEPTFTPTYSPSAQPSYAPSAIPTADPTFSPSAVPSVAPSFTPSASPTTGPSAVPTANPSRSPSAAPSAARTAVPTAFPTVSPTATPSFAPSANLHMISAHSGYQVGMNSDTVYPVITVIPFGIVVLLLISCCAFMKPKNPEETFSTGKTGMVLSAVTMKLSCVQFAINLAGYLQVTEAHAGSWWIGIACFFSALVTFLSSSSYRMSGISTILLLSAGMIALICTIGDGLYYNHVLRGIQACTNSDGHSYGDKSYYSAAGVCLAEDPKSDLACIHRNNENCYYFQGFTNGNFLFTTYTRLIEAGFVFDILLTTVLFGLFCWQMICVFSLDSFFVTYLHLDQKVSKPIPADDYDKLPGNSEKVDIEASSLEMTRIENEEPDVRL